MPSLFAVSDLHLNYAANREIAAALAPDSPDDWLIVAGDIAHDLDMVAGFLAEMRGRFAKVLFTPGNHDLWSRDDLGLSGDYRYRHLVELCHGLDVLTPEDPYPLWDDPVGPIAVAPVFVLYDYSLRPEGTSKEQAMDAARSARVMCTDELMLRSDPFRDKESWCADRLERTRARLDALPLGTRTVLAAHWPLHPGPVARLRHPEFAIWCGTRATADWHTRYRAVACVHGHLHIPISETIDGVPHEEVSIGYPRERAARTRPIRYGLRRILTA